MSVISAVKIAAPVATSGSQPSFMAPAPLPRKRLKTTSSLLTAAKQVPAPRGPAALSATAVPHVLEPEVSITAITNATSVMPVPSTIHSTATSLLKQSGPDYPILESWKSTIPAVDHQWISKAVFSMSSRGKPELDLRKVDRLWWYPPQPALIPNQCPRMDRYFAHRLLLWMPRKLWRVQLFCPQCGDHELTSYGLYRNTRLVLDIDDHYNLAAEYLFCSRCKRQQISWNEAILKQLDIGHRSQFPVLLTHMYACDVRVIRLMRQRGLGNSSTQLQKKLVEQHNENWLRKTIQYLTDCKVFSDAASNRLVVKQQIQDPPHQIPVPKYQWLLSVYCQDVLQRLDEVKAAITSVFGRVLKMDSTKKIVKKLAGESAHTAAWCSNISNEYGQVLMSVLTAGEGYGLEPMVRGIIARYQEAGVTPPELLYVDSHCCGMWPEVTAFRESTCWPDLEICLDIWHFMRRFSVGVTTDTHRLYGTFMSQLSHCIFQWDKADLDLLKKAKRSEMVLAHISDPSDSDVIQRITRKEMSLHCRRTTRGQEVTMNLLFKMLELFDGDQGRDTLGVPLLDHDRIWEIWDTQKCHIACIQDPEGISIYTQTGMLTKGGVQLPVFRCARGSTSLESFHLHLNRFIPGTSASATHFQAYILEGLVRWNEDRMSSAIATSAVPTVYSGIMRHTANVLGESVLGRKPYPNFIESRKYTGEKIGVEYLFSQTGRQLHEVLTEPDSEESAELEDRTEENVDEGFEDEETDDPTFPLVELIITPQKVIPQLPSASLGPTKPILTIPSEASYKTMLDNRPSLAHMNPVSKPERHSLSVVHPEQLAVALDVNPTQSSGSAEESVGPDNIEGFGRVDTLAAYLVTLKDLESSALTNNQAHHIISLWNNLLPYDRSPTKFSARHRSKLTKGRFKAPKTINSGKAGVDSVKRCFLGQNGGPAQWPDCNRYMEALITKLCDIYPSPVRIGGARHMRWTLIFTAYKKIRDMVLNNKLVMDQTTIQLVEINHTTLLQWYNGLSKKHEKDILEQGLSLHSLPATAPTPLPPPLSKPEALPYGTEPDYHQFSLPVNTVGKGGRVRRRLMPQLASSPGVSYILSSQPEPVAQIPISPLSIPHVPTSTLRYRKKILEKKQTGEFHREYARKVEAILCRKCGQDRKTNSHKQYFGNWFCPATATTTHEEWRAALEAKGYGKKKKKD